MLCLLILISSCSGQLLCRLCSFKQFHECINSPFIRLAIIQPVQQELHNFWSIYGHSYSWDLSFELSWTILLEIFNSIGTCSQSVTALISVFWQRGCLTLVMQWHSGEDSCIYVVMCGWGNWVSFFFFIQSLASTKKLTHVWPGLV